MAIRKLLRMGDDRLYNQSTIIKDIHSNKTQALIDDLIDTMRHYGGAGIAAPQIGELQRVFIIESNNLSRYPNAEPIPLTVLINPIYEILSEQQEEDWEGCLSVPGYQGLVSRYTHLRYQGYGRDGQMIEREVSGFHAKAIQHENDHLNGILFPMRVEDIRNFGCDDSIWKRLYPKQSYPEDRKQKVRKIWDFD